MADTESTRSRVLAAGALLAASGVMLGAFAAHGLSEKLGPEALGWWRTAVDYQMWHAIGLVALATVPLQRPGRPAVLIGVGTLMFSGSFYLMALTGIRWLGAITPIGGALMVAGWLLVAWLAVRVTRTSM